MTLEEIKEQYAKEKHYNSWHKFLFGTTERGLKKGIDIVAKRYAKAKLEEAAERVFNQTIFPKRNEIYEDGYQECQIEAQNSILETPLD